MATTTTSSTERYEFQPPTNIDAIRSSIMQRIKQRNSKSNASSVTSSPSPLTPPPSSHCANFDKKLPYLHLDNGLPSPPIETCLYEEEEHHEKLPTEVVVNALLELSQDSLPNEPNTATTEKVESSESIREKIRLLKEEKHKLFQIMKDLLSKPVAVTTEQPLPQQPVQQQPVTLATTTTSTTTTPVPMDTVAMPTPSPKKERSRSSSRENKSRPHSHTIIRSRSISHNDCTNNRPISRYYDRNSSSRLYNNSNSYYPYNRNSYPLSPTSSSSTSSSLNMSRRVINNNNNNSSYVSSRPQQLAVRSSSSSSTTNTSSSFRLPSCRPDRY